MGFKRGGNERLHSPGMQARRPYSVCAVSARELLRVQDVCEFRLPVARPCARGCEVWVVEDDAGFGGEFGVAVGRDVDDADGAWGRSGGRGEESGEEELGQEEVGDVVHLLG